MLNCCSYSANSMAPLSRLAGSLTQLRIDNGAVPASLSSLTRLQRLELIECDFADGILDAVLQPVKQLTALVSHWLFCCCWEPCKARCVVASS